METHYEKWYSPSLGRDMELKVYGRGGKPVLFIPCQDGRFFDFEGFKLTDTWSPWIESGQATVFSIDTMDKETFSAKNADPYGRIRRHEAWIRYITDEVVPYIRSKGTRVIVDSDGDITEMIPWLMDAGIEGALPLERQAGVDVNRLRRDFGDFILIGGYDKMVMKYGEAAMRQEFERILPAMKKGRYIPSVDHQTPPDVSLENYRIYINLLKEYCAKAVS
ncbi:MAG: hypothetical protein J6U72_05575 [Clostridia bacterium]|nr:hypothetical protein [Clostridia bacterium]